MRKASFWLKLWLTIVTLLMLLFLYDYAYRQGVNDTLNWEEEERDEWKIMESNLLKTRFAVCGRNCSA